MSTDRFFHTYTHLENTRSIKPEHREVIRDLTKTSTWVLLEKIHGSNFQFSFVGEEMVLGSRKQFLTEDMARQFVTCLNLFNDPAFKPALLQLVRRVRETQPMREKLLASTETTEATTPSEEDTKGVEEPDRVDICGEIFGGHYVADGVARDPASAKVQQGIQYHPSTQFLVFDIRFGGYYLPYAAVESLCKECGVKYVPPLTQVATFDEAAAVSPIFHSMIGETIYGLPRIEDNDAEGLVIRPYDAEYRMRNGKRVIFKNKSPAFDEVTSSAKPKKALTAQDLEAKEAQAHLTAEAASYINLNRLNSVRSKHVIPVDYDKAAEIKALVEDAMEEWLENHTDCDEAHQKLVRKAMSGPAAFVINKNPPVRS